MHRLLAHLQLTVGFMAFFWFLGSATISSRRTSTNKYTVTYDLSPLVHNEQYVHLEKIDHRWEVKDSDLVARNYRFVDLFICESLVMFSIFVRLWNVFLLMELLDRSVPTRVVVWPKMNCSWYREVSGLSARWKWWWLLLSWKRYWRIIYALGAYWLILFI